MIFSKKENVFRLGGGDRFIQKKVNYNVKLANTESDPTHLRFFMQLMRA